MNSGFGFNIVVTVISLFFLIRSFFIMTKEDIVYWIIGCCSILIFEFFVLKSFRRITFDEDNLYLQPYFFPKTEIIPIEKIIKIKRTNARIGGSFYSWLIYKDHHQVKKEVLFNKFLDNYNLFIETLAKKGINIKEIDNQTIIIK